MAVILHTANKMLAAFLGLDPGDQSHTQNTNYADNCEIARRNAAAVSYIAVKAIQPREVANSATHVARKARHSR